MKNMTFQKARKEMGKTMFKDKEMYDTYISLITDYLWNEQIENGEKIDFGDTDLARRVADKILKIIFS